MGYKNKTAPHVLQLFCAKLKTIKPNVDRKGSDVVYF